MAPRVSASALAALPEAIAVAIGSRCLLARISKTDQLRPASPIAYEHLTIVLSVSR
jgi:hypothetical protein